MNKRTILSLSEEIMRQADELAREQSVSRAEWIRRAMIAYVEECRRKKEEETILRERKGAFKETERIRREFAGLKDPDWDPVKIIREWRDKDRLDRIYERNSKLPLSVREDRKKGRT